MKRILVALLLAALLLPLVQAASAETLTAQQQAVVQTAIAFYLKNPYMQYGSLALTASAAQAKLIYRNDHLAAPEEATADRPLYSVCSTFCYLVYKHALGYDLAGSVEKCATVNLFVMKGDILVMRYVPGGELPFAEALAELRAAVQPGDVFVVRRKDNTGHAMLFVGDVDGDGKGDIIHCTHGSGGGSFDKNKGVDKYEPEGSIRLDDAFSTRMSEKALSADAIAGFALLRPLAAGAKDCAPMPSAIQRIKYPWLAVERTVSCGYYGSPETGDELTYTLTLRNSSVGAYTVPVKETVPVGTALKEAPGASVSGGDLSWSVPIAAGESRTLSYTVTVTAPRGTVITAGGGSAAGIPSNTLRNRVGGRKVDAEKLQRQTWQSAVAAESPEGVEIANSIYRHALGIDLALPSFSALTPLCFQVVGKGWRCIPTVPTEEGSDRAMLLDGMLGGQYVLEPTADRVLELRSSYFAPGDIFLSGGNMVDKKPAVFVYTGDALVTVSGGKVTTVNEKELVKRLISNVFFCLRPSLAYDDVNALVYEAKAPTFTDVKAGDWFYPYVTELAGKGVVNGMTATTFAPSGNLTYGQALKLIAKAVGEEDQPAGAHWASGYLALAKNKGWLTEDVDLNANITRLALCRIAAKAKGLYIQAQNPFKDTNDPDVLALNAAGIINGMTETTFQPDGLLTRAQISKIISLMMKA